MKFGGCMHRDVVFTFKVFIQTRKKAAEFSFSIGSCIELID